MGGSAGGLLMGVAVNLDPTLFGGIIAAVPFVDVLNTMSDDSLPLTPPEWPEWGNPLIDADAYDRIEAYSPYDQVASRDYPPMLITGGLTDPRVTYWEPAKWAAAPAARGAGWRPLLPQDQHGRRPWRRVGPLRQPQGNGARIRLRPRLRRRARI